MIDNLQYALDGVWRVLVASLIFGAGLPAVFALGIRGLASAEGGEAYAAGTARSPHAAGRVAAAVCFVIVVAGVALGITIIAATGLGKEVSFEHGYPTVVPKED